MKKTLMVIAFFLLSGISCADKPLSPDLAVANDKHSNIVLISVDTLRGDYFNAEHMPLTYNWAKENCRIYTNAHSCSTWTKPSHVTMLTGLRQKEHGAERVVDGISPEIVMIQDRLKDAGYRTIGFASVSALNEVFGLNRGFDHYNAQFEGLTPRTFEKAKIYLNNNRSKQQTFLFVHTYTVHEYYRRLYAPGEDIRDAREMINKLREDISTYIRRKLYAEMLASFDPVLYEFIQFLMTYFEDVCIIITSDHGEGLGEKDGDFTSFFHAGPPRPELTHIPIVVYGIDTGMTDELVGVDDIAGTIMQLAGIDPDPEKTLLKKRENVVAEYVPHHRPDSMRRNLAIIESDNRKMITFEDTSAAVKTPKVQMPEDVKEELKALGYLN